ncbi:hypothetical protein G6F56_010886 [Rhizopus delemar]|nr:hypothetical protein G6F56_010886 [Rhizopus delemar]
MSELSFEHFDPQYELCVDAQGKPIRPRKKPGRKPNPPSPAQRKAQNRAAQRAFRERKRQEIKEAETTNRRYLEMHQESLVTIQELQRHIKTLEYENGYLKGQLLTLKITCMAHRVDVPKFWDTGARDRMGSDLFTCSQSKDLPQPLEFFLDRSRRIVCGDLTGCEPSLGSTLSSYMISPALSSLMTNSFSFQSPLSLVESSDWKDKEEENWLSSDIIQLGFLDRRDKDG